MDRCCGRRRMLHTLGHVRHSLPEVEDPPKDSTDGRGQGGCTRIFLTNQRQV
jgi:hypothetical protein